MTTEVIKYCIDIANNKSFTKTAERNNISQQAMSQQIKNLETELGVRLFERSNRSVTVTPAGEAFIHEAGIAIMHISSAVRLARAFANGHQGVLSLGYSGPTAQNYLVDVFEQFCMKYPKIELNIEGNSTPEILSKFKLGTFDLIAVGDFEEFDTNLYTMCECKSDVTCAIVGKSHPLEGREVVYPHELLNEQLICLDLGGDPAIMQKRMNRFESILGKVPDKIKFVESTETIDMLVAIGNGYTLRNSALRNNYKNSKFSFLKIDGVSVVHSLRFIWKKSNTNPAISFFLDTAADMGIIK